MTLIKIHLGSASVVTDSTGNIVGEQRYYPFGETRLATGTLYTDKLFTGQRNITGLGIYHYQSRFYSPKLGRFLSADSLVPNPANPQDLNRFSYVRNNPIRYIDPTGHAVANENDGGCFKSNCGRPTSPPTCPPNCPPDDLGGRVNDGGDGRSDDSDTDNDGIPNVPDSSYATNSDIETSEQTDCLPGNLVECLYNHGVMPPGDYNITSAEYSDLLLAVSYDIDNQGPIWNYSGRGVYDTPFYNKKDALSGTICVDSVNCRDRSAYNYMAQGAWSAAAFESPAGMMGVVSSWKLIRYQTLPSQDAYTSAQEGYVFYAVTHPGNGLLIMLGVNNPVSFPVGATEWLIEQYGEIR